MKSAKRILSLVIVLCMLLSSVSVFAEYVNPYDKEQPEYEYMDSIFKYDMNGFEIFEETEMVEQSENFIFLSKLGILDDASGTDAELVKMTDFSVIMSRVKLGVGNALEGVYIKNADNSFATYKDALKYLIEALGYYYRCAEFGFSDESLLIVASQIGLINSQTKISNINTNITKGDLAGIITKALTTDLCETTQGTSGFSPSVMTGRNLLNTVHNVYEINGFVNAIYGMSILGNGNVRKGHMEINRRDVLCGEYNGADYYGKRINAYAKYDDLTATHTVIYITEDKYNLVYEIDFKDISYMNGQKIEYTDENGEEQELDISDVKNISLNGESTASISDIGNPSETDGRIILSASVKNGNLDCAVVWKYNYYVVGYNSLTQNRIGYAFGFEDDNDLTYIKIDESKINDVVIDGQASDIKNIKVDMIIRVARSASGRYTQIYAKTQKLNAKVSATDLNYVYADNNEYVLSKDLIAHIERSKTDTNLLESQKIPQITAGSEGTLYVFDNVLVAFKAGTQYKNAFLKSIKVSKGSINPSISLRMYTQDETWVELDVANKITLDGVYLTREKALEVLKADSSVIKNIVRYRVNSDNVVIELDTVRTTYQEQTSVESTLKEVEGNPYSITYDWTQAFLGDNCKYRFDTSTIIFKVPSNLDDEEEYKIFTNQTLPAAASGNEHTMRFYSPNDFNIVSIAVWQNDESGAGASINTSLYIEKITRVLVDADNYEYAYRVYGKHFRDGNARGKGDVRSVSYIVSEKVMEQFDIKVGMFIGAAVSGEKIVSVKITSRDGKVPSTDSCEKKSTASGTSYTITGTVKRVDPVNHYILFEYTITEEGVPVTYEYLICPRPMGIIDTTTNTAIQADINDFAPGDRVMVGCILDIGGYVIKNAD